MILGKDELGEIFDKIHDMWIQTRTTVIILAAADCDSICTTKILTSLLATEMISYQIHPVLSYEHIADYNEHVLQERIRDEELHTLIMINCGATVDLMSMLFRRPLELEYHRQHHTEDSEDSDLDDDGPQNKEAYNTKMNEFIENQMNEIDERIKIFVLDSHRPFNLFNVYDEDKIYLLQGGDEQKLSEFPSLLGDEDADINMSADDDDDIVFDDDDDLKQMNEFEPPTKRRKISGNKQPKKKQKNENAQRRQIRIQREQDEYYKYQEYGLNSSGIMYLMARSVQKDDNDMLWNAILGLTESFIYEKIDRDKYNEAISIYCDEVKRRNETYNAVSTMDNEARYNTDTSNVENSSIVSHRDSDHIQFSTEFRFILMRFWTLYDSMYYSRYVATKLGVWKQRGKENLKFLLAKMALPLSEAQQPYSSMKRQYKKKLPQLFEENMEYGLDENLTFGSFTKQHGGHQSISSSDMVYAITAVLESDFRVRSDENEHHQNNNQQKQNANANNVDDEEAEKEEADNNLALFFDDNAWKNNFFYGYDALSKDKQYLLRNAIKLAKERQTEIANMGIRLIEKRDIKTLGIMRYCTIENSNNFQSPMLLCKLALFIMNAYAAQTNKNAKHFVLASFNDKSNSYTVVGIPAKRYIGDVNKSPFYSAFEEARLRVNAKAKIVFFDGAVIQIHKDHFTEWLENLHERLLSYAF